MARNILTSFPHFSSQLHLPPKRRFRQSAAGCLRGTCTMDRGRSHSQAACCKPDGPTCRSLPHRGEVLTRSPAWHLAWGLIEAAFIVVLVAEDILSTTWWRDGQRLWRWGLMNLGRDGNPPLVDCRK